MLRYIPLVVLAIFCYISGVQSADCAKSNCTAPDCLCQSTVVPYGWTPEQAPQMIYLVFEGSLSSGSYPTYQSVLTTAKNPNGCPITGTFFLDHEYTDYTTVRQAWLTGHDIAIQSITSSAFTTQSLQNITNEIGGEQYYISQFSLLDGAEIQGERAPQGSSGGDSQFQVITDTGLLYDASLVLTQYAFPVWPYTLDYTQQASCANQPCPVGSYPGLWEFPNTDFIDGNGILCSNLQQCTYNAANFSDAYSLLQGNYVFHTPEKVPFMIPVPLAWLYDANNTAGLNKFLSEATAGGAYVVSLNRAVSWFQSPVQQADIGSFDPFNCAVNRTAANCNKFTCTYNFTMQAVTMSYCASPNQPSCPESYPWVDNLPF